MKKKSKNNISESSIIIYKSKNGAELEVHLKENNVWLTQAQIAELFGTKRPAITKHLNNIFKSGELEEKSVSSILEHTASDGKVYKTKFYNLDAIISVGYRVNSIRATQFRIWATKILKQYLEKGFAINKKKLLYAQKNLDELRTTIEFLKEKSRGNILAGQEQGILTLLSDYSKSLSILENYDNDKLTFNKGTKEKYKITYENACEIIQKLKENLMKKKEASNLFGIEIDEKLKAIIGNIYQTFHGKEVYKSIEEKAAHLLYFVIKDHPFSDGNKRIGSILFIYYLEKNNFLYDKSGQKKINDNALTALALLIAISNPNEKDKMIKITTNLLSA